MGRWKLYGNGVPWYQIRKPRALETQMINAEECKSKYTKLKSIDMLSTSFCAGAILNSENVKQCIEAIEDH